MPGSSAGKAIAAILMLGGLSLLSIITATITSAFVARRQAELQAAGTDPIMLRFDELAARLDGIEAELRGRGGDAPAGSPS